MKQAETIIESLAHHADKLLAKYQEAQKEISDTQRMQDVADRNHTPTVSERLRFIEKMHNLEMECQYIKGQWDCASWLLRQNA